MKAWWVSQLWQDLRWEPLHNKQRELSFGKGHAWRASSQWRLDGYTSFGKTSTGNPYAWIISSSFAIKGKDPNGNPESCLACLLACPQHVVFLLVATASRQLAVLRQQYLQRTTTDMVQLVFHNVTFFYINSSWNNDPILTCKAGQFWVV